MEERSGFFTFGAGLVVLIVIATGLSSIIEGREAKAKTREAMLHQISENSEILELLRYQLDEKRDKLAAVAHVRDLDSPCEKGKLENVERASRIANLVGRKAELTAAVIKGELAFNRYRDNFRDITWNAAVGEAMDRLQTLDGREYSRVTISKVTPEGLQIRHENGSARITADQLPEEWNRRFQWRSGAELSSNDRAAQ